MHALANNNYHPALHIVHPREEAFSEPSDRLIAHHLRFSLLHVVRVIQDQYIATLSRTDAPYRTGDFPALLTVRDLHVPRPGDLHPVSPKRLVFPAFN